MKANKTTLLPVDSAIDMATELINQGHVIAVPTDTVYGLVCRLDSEKGIQRIYELKRRPESIALPVLVGSLYQAQELVEDFSRAKNLTEKFWPGALTVILKRKTQFRHVNLGGDSQTIGLRLPSSVFVRELSINCGPLASTSANMHKQPTFEYAKAIREAFPEELLPLVVDGGYLSGQPSTVVDLTGEIPKIIRQGALPFNVLNENL